MDTVGSLALVPVVGFAAAWVAWRLRIPGILALLAAGLVVGPLLGWLEPDDLFGELLTPLVTLAVALILFEGGLSLSSSELRRGGRVVVLLLTVGVAVTFGAGALLGFTVLGLPGDISFVLAAVVVVTGPTVVGPLLTAIRPRGDVGAVLKAEGILVDPFGAILATLAYQVAFGSEQGPALVSFSRGLGVFALTGLAVGVAGAALGRMVLRRYLIPDALTTAFGLALAVGAFALANSIYEESGLLATTVLGIGLGTARSRDVRELLAFNESIRTVLIAGLFVVLGARLTADELESITWSTVAFVGGLVVVARPLAVALCTWGSALTWRERVLAGWMAPRGIVAASVASVFALQLQGSDESGASALVPTVFTTILVTIAVYGLTAPLLARRLGLSDSQAHGVLVVGAGPLAIGIGVALRSAGVRVLVTDTDHDSVEAARAAGLDAHEGTLVSEDALARLDLHGVGALLACTSNREAAALASTFFSPLFGRARVFQVPVTPRSEGDQPVSRELRGRALATHGLGVIELTDELRRGGAVRTLVVGADHDLAKSAGVPDARLVPLLAVHPDGSFGAAATDGPLRPGRGDRVVAFVRPAGAAI